MDTNLSKYLVLFYKAFVAAYDADTCVHRMFLSAMQYVCIHNINMDAGSQRNNKLEKNFIKKIVDNIL